MIYSSVSQMEKEIKPERREICDDYITSLRYAFILSSECDVKPTVVHHLAEMVHAG